MTNGELMELLSEHPGYAIICAELPDWDVSDEVDVEIEASYGGSANGPFCSLELRFVDPYERKTND